MNLNNGSRIMTKFSSTGFSRVTPLLLFTSGALVIMLIFFDLLQSSNLLVANAAFRTARTVAFAAEMGCIFASSFAALLRGRVQIVALFAILVTYIVFQCFLFSHNTGAPLNLNSSLPFMVILSVIAFSNSAVSVSFITKTFFWISLIYSIIYIIISAFFPKYFTNLYQGVEGVNFNFKLLGRDHYLDVRIILANAYVSFGLFYAYSKFLKLLGNNRFDKYFYGSVMIVYLVAIIIADSRIYTVLIFLTLALMTFWKYLRWWQPAVLGFYCLSNAASLWGIVDGGFNFYSRAMNDPSGYARYVEYEYAKEIAPDHLVFGLGIPSSLDELNYFAIISHVFSYSDIGAMGVMSGFGLIGVLTYFAFGGFATLIYTGRKDYNACEIAIIAQGLFFCLYAFTAPVFWGYGGTIFAGLILALYLRPEKNWRVFQFTRSTKLIRV